jgi:hypothetical protein
VIDDERAVEVGQVVADEGLDDIGLVARHHRAVELHYRRRGVGREV